MTITVNGVEISEDMIASQLDHYADTPSPRDTAIQQLILHTLLIQQAKSEGLDVADEQQAIQTLLDSKLQVPAIDEASCREFYDRYPERFSAGESAVASHILLPKGEGLEASLIKAKAEGILEEAQANPSRFAALAQEHSTCRPASKAAASASSAAARWCRNSNRRCSAPKPARSPRTWWKPSSATTSSRWSSAPKAARSASTKSRNACSTTWPTWRSTKPCTST